MASRRASAYRSILRELGKTKCQALSPHFRALFDASTPLFERDIQNVIAFMRAQREYKRLWGAYHPLFDLTAEDRVKATARRVGLDMPVTHESEK